ncbi:MAG TPA: aldo/keto reductase [Terriglobia bacterium]|jgi:aryl-alcohol dehydrogenase-like predicted oxidoreductase|nr:aldo/keto reductase [Terriglobia bacterium]
MRYRLLGETGLKVSEICLGAMTFGSEAGPRTVPGADEAESLAVIARFLDQGGNFIDTADGYAGGRSEEILGKALHGRRDDVVLATKAFFPTGDGPNNKGLTRKHIFQALEASLRRLSTDYVDLYQVHCFDTRTPIEETLSALDALVRQGKVRYLGCSNFGGWQLAKALGISAARGLERFECLQPQYSLVMRAADRELLPLCRSEKIGVIAWSPLAGGFLTGKYRPGEPAPPVSRLADSDPAARGWTEGFLTPHNFGILAALESTARALGKSLAQTALGWALAVPGMTAVIIGARNLRQLDDNLGAGGWDFPSALWQKLDEASALPLEYPQDFQSWIEPVIHGDLGG